mmetsp:Transcript_68123/g.120243  ORF Transcript_68123/g.120243 Transcript_68123/m.120243 type:complete len:401 (-) Transcript_68123:393-1595(-)
MAVANLLPAFLEEEIFMPLRSNAKSAEDGSSRSRSTSAGSSATHSLISASSPQPDIAKKSTIEIPEMSYPSPLVVRNTFLDYSECSPTSLADFFQEREIQSCPASGIMAPPGLENLGSIVESEAGDDFVPKMPNNFMATPEKVSGLPEFEYPSPFVVRNTFLDTQDVKHLGSLAEFMPDRQWKSCPVSGIGCPPGLSGVSQSIGSGLSSFMEEAEENPGSDFFSTPPPAYEPILPNLRFAGVPPPPPPMAAPGLAPPQQLPPAMEDFVPPPPPMQAPQLRISEALPESSLGSAEMPTVGSAGHHLGNCKPCAFAYTKGCGGGVSCQFCHLCAPGEKKRRQKLKHAVARISAKFGPVNTMQPPMAPAALVPPPPPHAAAGWAAQHFAHDAAFMYSGSMIQR